MISLSLIRPNRKICVFQGTGLKILGWVGTHNFLVFVFFGNNIIGCILKGILLVKMHKFIFFSREAEEILEFTSKR